jgi:cytochrome c-type biogenesis protein CcmH
MIARPLLSTLLAAAVALAIATASASAQTPPATGETMTVHPEAKAAIDRIKSPYCPGMMLEVCTSSGGAMLRDSIQRMAEAGLSADSIVELIIAEYGEEWRAEPKRAGLGLWAWALPPAVLAAGLLAVGVVIARRRRLAGQAPAAAPAMPEVAPADEARLRAALKELEEEEEPVF